MSAPPLPALKKPKVETNDDNQPELLSTTTTTKKMDDNYPDYNSNDIDSRQEQEEALVALIEHRTNEVKHLGQRIAYYNSQVASFILLEHVLLSLIDSPNLKF
jgi:response regulator RpfG family c-di-GMP phosphodiesterase